MKKTSKKRKLAVVSMAAPALMALNSTGINTPGGFQQGPGFTKGVYLQTPDPGPNQHRSYLVWAQYSGPTLFLEWESKSRFNSTTFTGNTGFGWRTFVHTFRTGNANDPELIEARAEVYNNDPLDETSPDCVVGCCEATLS